MLSTARFLLLIPCWLVLLSAQTATEVEITAEPSHHLTIDNDYVRVFEVEVAPHSSTLMHRHRHDYVFVTIGDANIENEVAGKPPAVVKLADGDTRFTPGNFAHIAENLSDRPFRNVTIELMQDEKLRQAASHWPEDTGERGFPGVRIKTLFVKDTVRVSEVVMDPGAVIPTHHHDGPHMIVAVSDVDLRTEREGESPGQVMLKPGQAKWVKGDLTHKVTNESKQTARFIGLDF
jgi:quercetin dioxygenase-like cupin family protein